MKYLAILLAAFALPAFAQQAFFAQLSSSETQLGSTVVDFDQVDGIQGMSYDKATGLTVDKKGAYLIIAAPQVITGIGCYDLWLNVNGAQVANSNVRYCSDSSGQTDVIVSQGAGCFDVGDVINPEQSGTGIEAIQLSGEPLIPSIIFTAYRIGNCK